MAAPLPVGSSSGASRAQPSPATTAAPIGSSADPSHGLRARKLSLSTRTVPAGSGSTSQRSPSSPNPSSPSIPYPDVGLGLMLDEVNGGASARSSIDSGVGNFARSRGSSIGADRSNASDESDEFFLAATGAPSDASMRRSSSRGLTPSTVTGPSGATASPLPIYTGSPNPSAFASSMPSPVPGRPYSPSHQAYNLGPVASSSNGATSIPMSRPPSYTSIMSSADMQRTRSGGSDVHSRQQSLTSACAPVTSSVLNTPKSDVSVFSPQLGTARNGGASWRTYDWGVAASEKAYSSDEDVREGGKRRSNEPDGAFGKVLALPASLLAFFLRPLQNAPAPARNPHSPPMNGSAKGVPGAATAKRYPLPIRLLTIAYLLFSFLYLSLSLSQAYLSPSSGTDAASSSRLAALRAKLGARGGSGQEGWQLVREYADGLSAKAGLELGWMTHKSAGEGSVAEPVAEGEEALDEDEWGPVRRVGHPDKPSSLLAMQSPEGNPLTGFTHTYRFSKMHDKVHWDLHDEIVPFAFHASSKPEKDDVTACMYTNEAWLQTLPSFVRTWRGPVSLVFETTHSRLDTASRAALLSAIAALRDADPLVKQFIDFHLVGAPTTMSDRTLAKTRERMIHKPLARNYQLNLARFFAPTDVVFLIGDARVTPSGGLRRRLTDAKLRKLVLEKGDALVIPTFGFVRDPTGGASPISSTAELRAELGITDGTAAADAFAGVSAEEFEPLAAEHVHQLLETLPLAPEEWPTRKQQLVQLVNTRVPSPESPTTAQLALFDRRWDANHGPSNWYLWRKSAADARLSEPPASGGGAGIGPDGSVGGGKELYRVVDYDLHYAPLVVASKKGQPWCTERFDDVRASCVYQMYLSGAEMWVVPDEWAYTLEVLEKRPEGEKEDPADKLKNSISSRLYGKFHQEACMHYGREFLSVGMWDSDKAQHLRETCARTLGSWGMGSA
ncbi:hypothetical protein JCM10450v2_005579 [Rhodotorula kratochvilovae]